MSEPVLARRALTMSMQGAAFREHTLASLWFVPLVCALAAFVVSRGSIWFDHHYDLEHAPHLLLPGDASALSTTAATIAAAMLTFLGVVFTTTLVAVQLASSQYSPRIVRLFVRSRLTQATLGVFLATFMFALNTLIAIRGANDETVPTVTISLTYLLVLATVVMFVAFLHGMVRLLRVQHLLRFTAEASHEAIDQAFPPASVYVEVAAPLPAAEPRDVLHRRLAPGTRGDVHRVLQAIDIGGLASAAAAADCWVEFRVSIGEHVGAGTTIARIHGDDRALFTDDALRAHLLFGDERSLLQDPGFGLRQLVDISSRALSPAVNDPTTAVQALLRIVDLLERAAERPDPSGWYVDDAGAVRVRLVEPDFERLARLGLTEVVLYGASAPQVTRCLAAAYDELERMSGPGRADVVSRLREEFLVAVDKSMPEPFADRAVDADRMGMG